MENNIEIHRTNTTTKYGLMVLITTMALFSTIVVCSPLTTVFASTNIIEDFDGGEDNQPSGGNQPLETEESIPIQDPSDNEFVVSNEDNNQPEQNEPVVSNQPAVAESQTNDQTISPITDLNETQTDLNETQTDLNETQTPQKGPRWTGILEPTLQQETIQAIKSINDSLQQVEIFLGDLEEQGNIPQNTTDAITSLVEGNFPNASELATLSELCHVFNPNLDECKVFVPNTLAVEAGELKNLTEIPDEGTVTAQAIPLALYALYAGCNTPATFAACAYLMGHFFDALDETMENLVEYIWGGKDVRALPPPRIDLRAEPLRGYDYPDRHVERERIPLSRD